jgi:hypothetical protein
MSVATLKQTHSQPHSVGLMIFWPGPITALLVGAILGLTLWTPLLPSESLVLLPVRPQWEGVAITSDSL